MPTADACVDAETKALNAKLKAYEDSMARRTAGLHDVAADNRAKAEAMRTSAQVNLRGAEHCEQLSKTCVEKCAKIPTGDGKAALGRCEGNVKTVNAMRDQAARDEALAKRTLRGAK